MAKAKGAKADIETLAAKVADELNMELVEVVLQKEQRGLCLCIFIDTESGVTLDDCERYHKRVQPLLEDIDYDFLEVSSPGADRPIKTVRDFERNAGELVEVKLFAPRDGSKAHRGALTAFDGSTVTISAADGDKTFDMKGVALIKPVIEADEAVIDKLIESEDGEQ